VSFFAKLFARTRYPVLPEDVKGSAKQLPAPSAGVNTFFNPFGDTPGSTGSKWTGGLAASGMAPVLNPTILRYNARAAYHTSIEARSILERHTDSVVDVGLKLNCIPDADILGISPDQADSWAIQVEAAFDLWAQSRLSSRAEQFNFYQLQRLISLSQQRDGEYFIRFYYSARQDLLNPLQLGVIDPSQIRGTGLVNTIAPVATDGDGIVRDAAGREAGYKVWVKQADGTYEDVYVPAYGARSGRVMMIHGFQPEYAGQGRGYSRLSHALQELENITDFKQSEIKKAIAQSSLFAFVKPSIDKPALNPFEGISHAGPVSSLTQTSDNGAQLITGTALEAAVSYTSLPEATVNVPGSMGVFNLNAGEEIKPFSNTAPVTGFHEFTESIAAQLSASLSIPLEAVLMRFNQNYSASRAALMLFWRVVQIWREELVSDFLNVVYENWLAGEIAAGRVIAAGWENPRRRAAWLKSQWVGAPMPNIDPTKTAAADQLYAQLGAQTLDRIALNFNGSSGKSNRAKLKKEFAELPSPPWSAIPFGGGPSNPEKAPSSPGKGA